MRGTVGRTAGHTFEITQLVPMFYFVGSRKEKGREMQEGEREETYFETDQVTGFNVTTSHCSINRLRTT